MSDISNIFGCFVSYTGLMHDATEEQKQTVKERGDLFSSYIWGEKGICEIIKKLNHKHYGTDLVLILFQFYINPIAFELSHLKAIESYRKNEKSIGIPIIVNDENFFNKSAEERFRFLKQSVLQKMDLLAEVVKKKKLDTNMKQFQIDLRELLN